MYLTDYHLHSEYSFDGNDTLRDVADWAIKRGMKEIAVTDHLDLRAGITYTDALDVKALYEDVDTVREEYAGRLIIKKGVELGQPQANPQAAEAFFRDFAPDFVIGSVHLMEKDDDLYYYDYRTLDVVDVMRRYIARLLTLAREYDFDVLGHITYPVRYMRDQGREPDMSLFYDEFKELFRVLTERGKGIECNAAGLMGGGDFLIPQPELVRLYLSCGGEIMTVGSDAHEARYVGEPIERALTLLKDAGVRYIATYENRKPTLHAL